MPFVKIQDVLMRQYNDMFTAPPPQILTIISEIESVKPVLIEVNPGRLGTGVRDLTKTCRLSLISRDTSAGVGNPKCSKSHIGPKKQKPYLFGAAKKLKAFYKPNIKATYAVSILAR